jgi:hypothetical protein
MSGACHIAVLPDSALKGVTFGTKVAVNKKVCDWSHPVASGELVGQASDVDANSTAVPTSQGVGALVDCQNDCIAQQTLSGEGLLFAEFRPAPSGGGDAACLCVKASAKISTGCSIKRTDDASKGAQQSSLLSGFGQTSCAFPYVGLFPDAVYPDTLADATSVSASGGDSGPEACSEACKGGDNQYFTYDPTGTKGKNMCLCWKVPPPP